jgi:hypothetical protein
MNPVRAPRRDLEHAGERDAERPATGHETAEMEVPERSHAVAEADGFEEVGGLEGH